MTDCFWLEFDPDKLAILETEAYELDLVLRGIFIRKCLKIWCL